MRNLITDVPASASAMPTTPEALAPASPSIVVRSSPRSRRSTCAAAARHTRDRSARSGDRRSKRIDAIVLSGGSALRARSPPPACRPGCARQGRGFQVRDSARADRAGRDPVRSLSGGDKNWGRYPPYRELGHAKPRNLRPTTSRSASARRRVGRDNRRPQGRHRIGRAKTRSGLTVGARSRRPTLPGSMTAGDDRTLGRAFRARQGIRRAAAG